MRRVLSVLALATALACSQAPEPAATAGATVTADPPAAPTPSFASGLTKVRAVAPGPSGIVPGVFRIRGSEKITLELGRHTPYFEGCRDEPDCLKFLDLEAKPPRMIDHSNLKVASYRNVRSLRAQWSADERFLAWREDDTPQRAFEILPLVVHEAGEPASAAKVLEPANGYFWATNELLLSVTDTTLSAFAVTTGKRSWSIPTSTRLALSAASGGTHVLAYGATEAKLVDLADGATVPVQGWELLSGASYRRVEVLPDNDGFVVSSLQDRDAWGVARVGLDARLEVVEPVSHSHAIAPDGKIAVAVPTGPPGDKGEQPCEVVVHEREGKYSLGVITLLVSSVEFASGSKRVLHRSANEVVLDTAPAHQGARFTRLIPDALIVRDADGNPRESVRQTTPLDDFSRAIVSTVSNLERNRVALMDLARGTQSEIMTYEGSSTAREVFVEPNVAEPAVVVGAELFSLSGKKLRALQDPYKSFGWRDGVFYYATRLRSEADEHYQIRGATRDGLLDVAIGSPADEIVWQADRVHARPVFPIAFTFRSGVDVLRFVPRAYEPEPPASPSSQGTAETPPDAAAAKTPSSTPASPEPVAAAPSTPPATATTTTVERRTEASCTIAHARGRRDGVAAIALVVAALAVRRRQRARQAWSSPAGSVFQLSPSVVWSTRDTGSPGTIARAMEALRALFTRPLV